MVLAMFLPWFTVGFTGKFNNSQAEISLFGSVSGDTQAYNAIRPDDLARLSNELLSPIAIGMVVITLSIILINIVWPSRIMRFLLLGISIIGLLYTGFEFLAVNSLIESINRNIINSHLAAPPTLHSGIGLLVWAIGAIIIFVSSVIILVLLRPGNKINRGFTK